jgi:hypothetical protein
LGDVLPGASDPGLRPKMGGSVVHALLGGAVFREAAAASDQVIGHWRQGWSTCERGCRRGAGSGRRRGRYGIGDTSFSWSAAAAFIRWASGVAVSAPTATTAAAEWRGMYDSRSPEGALEMGVI